MNKFLTEKELIEKLRKVELLCVDMDGTLTDGGMYLDENSNAIKKFYAHDGTGLQMIKNIGVKIALITTSLSNIAIQRSRILGFDEVIVGSHKKGEDILNICSKLGIDPKNTAHMGDDVNDILGFQVVGIPISVANSSECILDFSCYTTKKSGGYGAVREICDLILIAKTGKIYGPPYIDHFVQ